jgi:hypothetical protein
MTKPYVIVFAGVPGTSKTPIAHFLSCELGLPIVNTDQIRYEVREDWRLDSINKLGGVEEYQKRLSERFDKLLASKRNFIFDGSMDRRWNKVKIQLQEAGYDWFMIDMELSKPFLIKLFDETGRAEWSQKYLDDYLEQHQQFIEEFGTDISLKIEDNDFPKRLDIGLTAVKEFANQRSM